MFICVQWNYINTVGCKFNTLGVKSTRDFPVLEWSNMKPTGQRKAIHVNHECESMQNAFSIHSFILSKCLVMVAVEIVKLGISEISHFSLCPPPSSGFPSFSRGLVARFIFNFKRNLSGLGHAYFMFNCKYR